MALDKFRERLRERLASGVDAISESDMDAWVAEAHLEPSAMLDAAGSFGTEAHDLFEKLLRGSAPTSVPHAHRVVVENFEAFRVAHSHLRFDQLEVTVWSDAHRFAGTVDAIARAPDGRLVLMDWKTGNRIHSEAALQVAAYSKAYEELHGERVSEAWVVRFDKNKRSKAQVKVVADLGASFETFLNAAKLWDAVRVDFFARDGDGTGREGRDIRVRSVKD